MKPYISSGNIKTGSIPTFSLPAIQTCPGSTELCRKFCYARKAEKAYPGVLPCRKRNLKATKTRHFCQDVIDWILARKPRFFRIHESGDFYSQGYLDNWLHICRNCPETRFLAFTKSFHLDYSKAPKNLTIVWSIWSDTKLSDVPRGPRAYAGDCRTMRQAIECPGSCDTCGLCWALPKVGKHVHFDIH